MGNICCGSLPGDKPFKNIKGQKATFGMQCFCNSEPRLGVVPGVIRTRVGFSADKFTEIVEVEYDPAGTAYDSLLIAFWEFINPIALYDYQLASVIYFHSLQQKLLAEQSMIEIQKNYQAPVVVKILPAAGKFLQAIKFHQKFRLKQHTKLLKTLNGPFTFSQCYLTKSHFAARLNGYICRYGTIQMFEAERDQLGLTPEVEEYIRGILLNI